MFENIHTDFSCNLEDKLAEYEVNFIEANKEWTMGQAPVTIVYDEKEEEPTTLLDLCTRFVNAAFISGCNAGRDLGVAHAREMVKFIEVAVLEWLASEGFTNVDGLAEQIQIIHEELNKRYNDGKKT